MYSPLLTYGVYDLNSSLFLEVLRNVLEVELSNQVANKGKTFLPLSVKKDEYLLNPVSDLDINPAFCSILKAKQVKAESNFHQQSNEKNTYIIGILAEGLENLRKIADAIFIILNDMDVKNYLFTYKDAQGNNLIADSGTYRVISLSNEFEVSQTINDRNIIYGSLSLEVDIAEIAKLNTYNKLTEVDTTLQLSNERIHDQELNEMNFINEDEAYFIPKELQMIN